MVPPEFQSGIVPRPCVDKQVGDELTNLTIQSPNFSHVFLCTNQRAEGESCCNALGASEALDHAKGRIKSMGLAGPGKVRFQKAGCLERCGEGPVLVVYPEAVWYTYVDKTDIDEIIDEHLVNGRVVERLKLSDHA